MPTNTFHNLPLEKREKLTQAIFSEYARVSPDEVSINRIVCAAGIPRGSYYQYFSNREDLLEYVLSECRERIFSDLAQLISQNRGNLEAMLLTLFDHIIALGSVGESAALFRNVFAHLRAHSAVYSKQLEDMQLCDRLFSLFIENCRGLLAFSSKQEALDVYEILLGLERWAIASALFDLSHRDQIRQSLQNKLQIFRRGIEGNIVKNREAHTNAC